MGDLGHLRGQEESPHDQVGCRREGGGKKSGGRMGPVPLRGAGGKKEVPTLREAHSWWGSAGQRRALGYWGIGGKSGQGLPCPLGPQQAC